MKFTAAIKTTTTDNPTIADTLKSTYTSNPAGNKKKQWDQIWRNVTRFGEMSF